MLTTVTFAAQLSNISEGLFPDGAVGASHFMPNWTPRRANQLGLPPAPAVTSISFNAAEAVLTFTSLPGRTYRLEFKDDLDAPNWTPLNVTHTAVSGTVTLNLGGGVPQRFFRIRLE